MLHQRNIDIRSLVENIPKKIKHSVMDKSIMNYVRDFKQNGLSVLKKLNEETIMKLFYSKLLL